MAYCADIRLWKRAEAKCKDRTKWADKDQMPYYQRSALYVTARIVAFSYAIPRETKYQAVMNMAEADYWSEKERGAQLPSLSDYTNVWIEKEWHNLPNDFKQYFNEQSGRHQVNPRPRIMGSKSFAFNRVVTAVPSR